MIPKYILYSTLEKISLSFLMGTEPWHNNNEIRFGFFKEVLNLYLISSSLKCKKKVKFFITANISLSLSHSILTGKIPVCCQVVNPMPLCPLFSTLTHAPDFSGLNRSFITALFLLPPLVFPVATGYCVPDHRLWVYLKQDDNRI